MRLILILTGLLLISLLSSCGSTGDADKQRLPAEKPLEIAADTPEPVKPVIKHTGTGKQVKISATAGDIIVELNAEKAPKTVTNFLNYVKKDFYKGKSFKL